MKLLAVVAALAGLAMALPGLAPEAESVSSLASHGQLI